MDEVGSTLDPDELMDLDEPDSFDLDDVDEDDIPDSIPDVPEDLSTSPFQLQLSSGPGSTATSTASSPQNTVEEFLPPFNFSGKPVNVKRGRGRPRREAGAPVQRRGSSSGVPRVRRTKSFGFSRGSRGSRSVRIPDRMDFDFSFLSSPAEDSMSLMDSETGAFMFPDRDRPPSAVDDLPYAPENWPGKSCAFCNLGERSQLGQGEMVRLNCPEGFNPQKSENSQTPPQTQEKDAEDKSPRGPVTIRRTKNWTRLRHQPLPNEHIDELSIIGYLEEPSVALLFEQNQFYVHRNCALWSSGVNRTENFALENVGPVVLESSSKKCSFCNHYGASLTCKHEGCSKIFHFPCATASGAFQELSSLTVYCTNHIGQASLLSETSTCYTCKQMGDIANLMYCSSCGAHYHGTCVGLAQLPGVRAGWQCRKCRICQTCRMTGDESKLMTCEHCDKVYHASCQRPIVTSIPKYGWKCRCCRVCGDCGSRTPGAGLSSRWHLHYTVCDSCYQQRNKGCCCPMCHRAYRSHAHREMVQCTICRKFVHGTCDPEADLSTYHQKKDSNPDYEYCCPVCKSTQQQHQQQQSQYLARQIMAKRSSTDDPGDLSGSQDSLYDDMSEFDFTDDLRNMGLGRGKPFASKIAKKRLGYPTGIPGRPKGSLGKGKGIPGKNNFIKRQRLAEFGRKRGAKAKVRGMFGAPGVGLQRPTSDGKGDEEPGIENRLVLCSAKDKFVLTQDICVMCGSLGTDHEGMLIACVQCGQCYHPYCVSVKVTKVVLQKGWRCLDCTICEGCGQRNDEGRLILCDDCDVSYHTYCMDPPLDYVPHGNWKCKWCACCRTCGATDPGFNCTWMNGCTECGPCASHTMCPSCGDPYSDGELIIQCCQCERWLHGACDFIKTEQDAEKCAEDGYNCILCRPRDVPPPHLVPPPLPKPPTPTRSPEIKSLTNYFMDGVCLSETGHCMIKSMNLEYHGARKKRKKLPMLSAVPTVQDKEAGIMATIESVVAGGSTADNSLEDTKIEMVDFKIEEQQELYKDGMIWTKEDGAPPDGFTIFTMESGISVLRRKRQRNLQKLGIGGFLVRMRGFRSGQENDDVDMFGGQSGQTTPTATEFPPPSTPTEGSDKPKRKPIRRKPKSKLSETFPPYLQEAFFGRDLMDITDLKPEVDGASSDDEKRDEQAIRLTADELIAVENANKETDAQNEAKEHRSSLIPKEEEDDDENTEDLKDVLALPGDLLDTDLVNSIINEDDDSLTKNTELEALGDDSELGDTLGSSSNSKDAKDELSDILNSHFNLESIPNINSKDVEDIFKGVLTDEPQPEPQLAQEPSVFQIQSTGTGLFHSTNSNGHQTSLLTMPHLSMQSSAPIRPTVLPGVGHSNLNSPSSFPPPSPYHSEYSNSPQFSPAFSEPPSPWVGLSDSGPEIDSTSVGVPSTYNQRSSEKMKADEGLGHQATISAVLYANVNHPEWKAEFPNWSDRYKQIIKKWRTLSQEQKAPFLQHARDNRSQLRMKKAQQSQTSKDASAQSTPSSTTSPGLKQAVPTVPASGLMVTNSSGTAPQLATSQPTVVVPATTQTTVTTAAVAPPPIEVCTQSIIRPTVPPSLLLTNNASSTTINSSVSVSSSPPKSPPTHQLFTIKGTFAGPGDHVGPAPNVTVNPNYQPPHEHIIPPRSLLIAHHQSSSTTTNSSSSDQQIRVLTPSEIMRTLPSLCQENYEPAQQQQPPDQEKITHQQKSMREAEQERQWKQLQALRQQQAQQQQHVIQEQRVQVFPAIARVQRTVSDPNLPFMGTNQSSPLHVTTTPSELSPAASPSPGSRQFMGMKSPSFMAAQSPKIQTPTSQSPSHDFSQQQQSVSAPSTPDLGSTEFPQVGSSAKVVQFAPRMTTPDPFGQPAPQRPQFSGVPQQRATLQQQNRTEQQPEIARQLRELLQRQQFKNLDLVAGKASQRVWPPEGQESQDNSNVNTGGVTTGGDATFRQPLPPSITRPRLPLQIGARPGMNIRLQQIDARLQGLDPRMRLILQQQQRLGLTNQQQLQQGQISGQAIRFSQGTLRPATVEQYEQLLQQRQAQLQQNRAAAGLGQATSVVQQSQLASSALQRSLTSTMAGQTVTTPTSTAVSSSMNVQQGGANDEIPDNVTAELEKLEQETGTMVELQGVSDILGGLGDDDDELLAEMGADFNILEYADPELEALAGEKTNILDLELEEDIKQKRKEAKSQKEGTSSSSTTTPQPTTSESVTTTASSKEKTSTVSSSNTAVTSTADSINSQQPVENREDGQQQQSVLEQNLGHAQQESSEPSIQSQNLTVSTQQQLNQQLPLPHFQQSQMHQPTQLQQQLQLQKQAQMQQNQLHQNQIQQQSGLHGALQQQQSQQGMLQQQSAMLQQQQSQQSVLQQGQMQQQNVLQQQQQQTGVLQQQQGVLQQQQQQQPQQQTQQLTHPAVIQQTQNIHQQMIHQVQQAAAQGRPMPPGAKLTTPDGIVGVVLPNNTVQLQIPANYQQRLLLHLQNQKLQMRLGQQNPRMLLNQQQQQQNAPVMRPRMAAPPPPPPPYPGPPPPYPGNVTPQHQQMGLRMGPGGGAASYHVHPTMGHHSPMQHHPMAAAQTMGGGNGGGCYPPHHPPPIFHHPPHLQRRGPLLLEEQPLLLEDLLEQEKREQEKQHHEPLNEGTPKLGTEQALLSDHDFERLKADVFNTGPPVGVPGNQGPSQSLIQQQWQPNRPIPTPTPQAPVVDPTPRIPLFQANLRPPPPLPPENIATEQDKQTQIVYEQWLTYQNNVLNEQLKYYETEVQKLRKSRKSLNSKQRQLKKTGGQLNDTDAAELQRISAEQAVLQKQLESSRKQMRQHGMLIQEYRNKQQPKQQSPMGQSPLQLHSPLGPPSASPHHASTSQSPMMSPQQSPLMQHSSPMHSPGHVVASPGHVIAASPGHVISASPGHVVAHSPGPGSMVNLLQSPGSSMSPMQPSRIGTPLSQGEGSPGPAQSPSQVILPPPGPRMTSPQHRRIVTSPVGYSGELRTGTPQMRFVRTPMDHSVLQQRIRMQSPIQNLPPKAGTPSPLNSPPPGQMTQQQILQKQLHQQAFLQQQLNQVADQSGQDPNLLNSQRIAHLIQQRNLSRQQQQQQQQQQQIGQTPAIAQPQPLTPQQHQLMVQQQQQLAKQQQQQLVKQQQQQMAMQQQARLNQQQSSQINPPQSPMQAKSPMICQQIMSPHSMPASPMPPKSPMMVNYGSQNMPSSPASGRSPFHQSMNQPPSSPMMHQYHPVSSPMMLHSPHGMHRPASASSSPMPERPTSVENPGTPRTPYSIDSQSQDSHAGGNLSNSNTPVPFEENSGGGSRRNSLNPIPRDDGGGGNPNNPSNPIPQDMSTGGGNPRNPNNPIPLPPPGWGKFGYFKLGLRGGAPMWPGFGRGEKRVPTPPTTSSNAPGSTVIAKNEPEKNPNSAESSSSSGGQPQRKEAHITKVSILKRKPSPLVRTTLKSLTIKSSSSSMSSDFSEYADDNSSGSPATPSSLSESRKSASKQDLELVDYEDDNSTILSSEISLSSAAQQNEDELEIAETLSQNDVGEVLSSPLEPDQISDEFLLFQENIDVSSNHPYSDQNETEEEYSSENTRIVMIRTPTTSDDEFAKKFNVVETTESEEAEASTEQSSEATEVTEHFEETGVVVPQVKSPKEQISTEEDFEQLIDEGSRKDKLKQETQPKTVSEVQHQKFSTGKVYNFQQQKPIITTSATVRPANVISQSQKLPQKISLITTAPIIQNIQTSKSEQPKQQFILTPSAGPSGSSPKITSLILTQHPLRSNIINVSQKGSQQSPAITIVSANTTHIASILPNTKFTVPVISASDIRKLPNIKVIDKHPSALSLTGIDSSLPKKIFEDDSVSPDSICDEDKKESSDEKSNKADYSPIDVKSSVFLRTIDRKLKPQQSSDLSADESSSTVSKHQISHIISKEKIQRASPGLNVASPVIIHHAPELKMTAQIIQERQSQMHITATESGTSDEDKSVVISIPSPTPSQEQMLDNLSALENRRRDFDSFEDVLDMIENMQTPEETDQQKRAENKPKPTSVPQQVLVSVTTAANSNIPQLSPLSQPTELTTNMANASQQLRSLLSSFHTTTSSQSSSVESVVKTINSKLINSSSGTTTSPVVASRVIQQAGRQSPVVTTISTVIVPNIKQKLSVNSAVKTSPQLIVPSSSVQSTTPGLTFLPGKSLVGLTSLAEHLKQVPSATFVPSQPQNASVITAQSILTSKPSVISSPNSETNKKSLSLTAMLQNQPSATPTTNSSADTITAASLLATPVSLSRSGFSAALVQAQPNAVISSTTTAAIAASSSSVITSSPFRTITSTTNLLHTQLTKQRTKSLDDIKDLLKSDDVVKSEQKDITDSLSIKQEITTTGCKYSTISSIINRCDESQNVLLKKLLQNTACASTQSPPPTTPSATVSTVVPSISTSESPKPSTPTLSSLLPPTIKTEPQTQVFQPKPVLQRATIRETSFVSSPVIQQIQTSLPSSTAPTQQLHIDIKKCAPPSRTSSRDELLSPCTPKSNTSQDSSLQTPPLIIKKEFSAGCQSEVKKELLDDTSQHSEFSEPGKSEIKEEILETAVSEEQKAIDKEELKKQKRRMYAQKRRMNQLLQKEAQNKPQKRPRKNSKLEEDYDTYIDGVLSQIRHLPPIIVSEPLLHRNYGVMPVFGSGDMSKIGTKGFDPCKGELTGSFGHATLSDYTDFYNTVPYGDLEPLPEKSPPSTQRGFYDQEFPLIKFDNDDHKKFDLFSREDTPESVCSTSSPELEVRRSDTPLKYQGLRLISDDEDNSESIKPKGRFSPTIPIIKPIPVRLKPSGMFIKELQNDSDKENVNKEPKLKLKSESESGEPLKDNGNVTVTLTLTSSAAEDIIGVLKDLANILQIPAPKTYQIVDRTSSPPAKLGLYRTKGRDGKEGAPIDIQSILNGAAKFCKHCDVVILSNRISKKLSDLSFLAKDSDLLSEGDELHFCSSTCYMQFALMHRSPSISEDKAAAIVDHLSQKDQMGQKQQKLGILEGLTPKQILANRLSADSKDVKIEDMDMTDFSALFGSKSALNQHKTVDQIKPQPPQKTHKNIIYKRWVPGCLQPNQKHKKLTDKDLMEMLYRMGITVTPPKMPDDTRRCMFCQGIGDGVADGPARLLNFDVDKWVHLNCALWSDGVYETVNGALMNLENSIQQSLTSICIHCEKFGATIRCFKTRCSSVYHLNCAVKDNAVFYKNKTIYCTAHVQKHEKDNELTTLSVSRRVYVNRDENRQVAAVMHHSDENNLLRVGSLIFLNVGQLLPHQLQNFHTANYIYPIGYKIIRFYWSMRVLNKRCRYICLINDLNGRPEFKVIVQEPPEEDLEFKADAPKAVWAPILEKVAAIRRDNGCLQLFPRYVTGEDLFGLTEPAIVRVLESLPGIETLSDYKFKYGRNPLLELPLAINPTGAARSEPRLRHMTHWKRQHTHRTTGSTNRPMFGPSTSSTSPSSSLGEAVCPYSKQFVHSKSSQYKKMKQEWRNNVYLARSKIQGLGLYAARDLEKHTMVIEYIGEVIRSELSECREKKYEARNRGIYMFRLDDDRVVDATLSGGLARYINHSCNPNCVAEIVEIDRDLKIIIFAKRRIQRGEELAYDYKFDIEDDQNKISCCCGAPNCRKWMN